MNELDLRQLSDRELGHSIVELEAEREALEGCCRVVRRRIAILRAERLARVRDSHFDVDAVAEAVVRRLARVSSARDRADHG